MKGVVFNIVEEIVTDRFGDDTWDALLEAANAEGAYTALGNYDDTELAAIVIAASRALETTEQAVLELVGEAGFERLAARYPGFEEFGSSADVLESLNDVIHPQVLALYPGAAVPVFDCVRDGDRIDLDYQSSRGLCHLAVGLARGAVAYFDETATVTQPECRHDAGSRCVIRVDFAS